jgi:hypothetical protein
MGNKGLLVGAIGLLMCWVGGVCAAPLEVDISATGTGTIGGVPFSNSIFLIRMYADTANRQLVQPGIYHISPVASSIEIWGIGTASFTLGTRVFVNNPNQIAGFSRAGTTGSDILDVDGSAFSTWDLLSDVGPVFDATPHPVSQASGLATTLGTLNFTAYSNSTFTANVVPEPGAVMLLILGLAVGVLDRRRKS